LLKLKRLNKKYPSLKKEMAKLTEELYKAISWVLLWAATIINTCFIIAVARAYDSMSPIGESETLPL